MGNTVTHAMHAYSLADGHEVMSTDTIMSTNETYYEFKQASRLTVPGKSGKVIARMGNTDNYSELYAHIFGLIVCHGKCTHCGQFVNVTRDDDVVTVGNEDEICDVAGARYNGQRINHELGE